MSRNVRQVTDDVISAVEDGFLSWETVAKAALVYMSEDDVADMAKSNDWALFPDEDDDDDDDDVDDDVEEYHHCPECGKELGRDGRCYNSDCDDYDPISQYSDPHHNDEVEDEYKEMRRQEEEAEKARLARIKDEEDSINESQSQEIDQAYKNLSAYYGVDLNELVYGSDGFMTTKYPKGLPDFNGDIIYTDEYWTEFENWLKDVKGINLEKIRRNKPGRDLIEATESEEQVPATLNYDTLKFYSILGDMDFQYQCEVMDQFDNDKLIDYVLHVVVTPEHVVDYICVKNNLAKDLLTAEEAQPLIDDIAKDPEDFYEWLKEDLYELATEKAQEYYATEYVH